MDEQKRGLSGDCLGEEIVVHKVPVGFLEFRFYLVHDDGWCDESDNGGCFIYLVCPIACHFDVSLNPVASNVSRSAPTRTACAANLVRILVSERMQRGANWHLIVTRNR